MTSTMTIEYGDQVWRNTEGEYHRLDGPAVISSNGRQTWYFKGKVHRLDGPVVIYPDGTQYWWVNGKRHRSDGPAMILSNGYQAWYISNNHVDPGFIQQYIKHNPPTKKEQKLLVQYWGEGSF